MTSHHLCPRGGAGLSVGLLSALSIDSLDQHPNAVNQHRKNGLQSVSKRWQLGLDQSQCRIKLAAIARVLEIAHDCLPSYGRKNRVRMFDISQHAPSIIRSAKPEQTRERSRVEGA